MFESTILHKGKYTGSIVSRTKTENSIFSTTQYPVGHDEGGAHCHENPHISFVFEGGDIEERSNKSYERKAGEIFFYNAGETHQTIVRKRLSKNLNIELEEGFFIKNEVTTNQIANSINKNIDAKFLVLKILHELHLSDANSSTAIDFLMLDLCSFGENDVTSSRPGWVKNLSDILNDRWDEQITLKELSIALGVHSVTISKYFRKYFFCTYGEFMRKLKIERSIPYILDSEISLTEIAYLCGFADQSHFTRCFKNFIGFLPRSSRRL